MARMRTLKPGLFKNDRLAELPIAARYVFAGLTTLADREGRLCDRPKWIHAELLPWDRDVDMDELLRLLADTKDVDGETFIIRYEAQGQRFIQITKFHLHQTPHVREAASVIPSPWTDDDGDSVQTQPRRTDEASATVTRPKPVRSAGPERVAPAARPAPTREAVRAYFKTIGGDDQVASKFFDHYSANGWLVGGENPMKSWRACARRWLKREPEFAAGGKPRDGTEAVEAPKGRAESMAARVARELKQEERKE